MGAVKDQIKEIIEKVSDMNPYKEAGNRDSYSKYNEGWSDACDVIEGEVEELLENTNNMKLYHLYPKKNIEGEDPWSPWYDKAFGFIVRAETEEEARRLANEQGGDETGEISNDIYRIGGDPWLDAKFSECVELTEDGEKGVIIRDFAQA